MFAEYHFGAYACTILMFVGINDHDTCLISESLYPRLTKVRNIPAIQHINDTVTSIIIVTSMHLWAAHNGNVCTA